MSKLVIYFAGGTMTGVFGAGVASAFENHNIYAKVSAVYGSSAGIMTGAYFLSKQTKIGSSVFWENLSHDFISLPDFFIGVWQRFQNKFLKTIAPSKLRDALDIDYLFDVVNNEKRLNTDYILSQKIPLYLKLLNIDGNKISYLDIRRPDILELLRVGVSPFPYVHKLVEIDNQKYIDAGIIDILGVEAILQRHPQDKIILVLNRQPNTKLKYKLKNILEGLFVSWMLKKPDLYSVHASAEDHLKLDLEIIKNNPRVVLLAPEYLPVESRTTSPKKLLLAYGIGVEAGNRLSKTILDQSYE